MSDVTYMVDAATLPQGSCPATYQELAELLASIYSVTVSTNNTGIYVSSTKPADTTLVWKQIGSDGRPVRDYIFVGGLWLSRHAMEPGEIVLWKGSIASLWSFDGGDGTDPTTNPPTAISGAMWKVVSELAAKFPIGVGTLPSGTAIAVGDTGGEEKHTLIQSELPDVSFPIKESGNPSVSGTDVWGSGDLGNGSFSGNGLATVGTSEEPTRMDVKSGGSGTPMNNLPPYYGIYFIERTAKQYFVVP